MIAIVIAAGFAQAPPAGLGHKTLSSADLKTPQERIKFFKQNWHDVKSPISDVQFEIDAPSLKTHDSYMPVPSEPVDCKIAIWLDPKDLPLWLANL